MSLLKNSHLTEKIQQNSQRKNLASILALEAYKRLSGTIDKTLFFPESSNVISHVISITNSKNARCNNFLPSEKEKAYELVRYKISALQKDEINLMLFFPSYSRGEIYIASELPVLVVDYRAVGEWFEILQGSLDFFFCIFPNFCSGVVLDSYAANPELHGSDEPMCDIYSW